MNKRRWWLLIAIAVVFVGTKIGERYFRTPILADAAPSEIREVSALEFLTAAGEGRLIEGKIGFYSETPGLAELVGKHASENTSGAVFWRSTARLTDEDVKSLRGQKFREGSLALTAIPRRPMAARETTAATFRIVGQVTSWLFAIALVVFIGEHLGARTGLIVPKTFQPVHSTVKFSSVAGCDEAKEEVSEIVEFLKKPERFAAAGGRMPRGVLLVGPPGTGKTMLAKAVAGEANAKFYSLSGSDFVEMYVGVGASRIRSLFKKARENAPSIIFIDELDAVGRQRSNTSGSGAQQEHEHTLNALLVEMDGFATDAAVVVFAATNRAEIIDKALLRPGRFDRQVTVDLPDKNGRREILRVHSAAVKFSDEVKLDEVARVTPGFSGADLANLVNEGALHAARRGRTIITWGDIEEAKDKISWGRERRREMSEKDKRIVAVHEAGHALMQVLSGDESMRLHKVTILPRGKSLGSTQFTPERDVLNYSKEQVLARIRCLMAGRIAEEIALGSITSGASGDIQEASRLARQMVFQWGMSMNGFLALTNNEGEALGSPQSLHEAEGCVKELLSTEYNSTRDQLTLHKPTLDAIVTALLERETISGDEVRELAAGSAAQNA
ncbi:MAG: ATP-dependent zinc metalloprotease FtsH [Nibricoccus sp.]